MITIKICTKITPLTVPTICCDQENISYIANMLERSDDVIAFEVYNDCGLCVPRDFGFGRYEKWVESIEEVYIKHV